MKLKNIKMNTIYAYSTNTYLEKNWIKVGETSLTADERISQQDTTSNPEALQKLKEWSVPSTITDKIIHGRLEEMGFLKTRIDKDREWFEVSVDDVSRAINDLQYGVRRKDDYSPRPEQKDCVKQAVNYFEHGDDFLVNAKMRYGKTFVSYLIAKQMGAQNILVLTYKPSVKDGWHNDLVNHVLFDGWSYADTYAEYKKLDGPRVMFASFQDINDLSKSKWRGVRKEQFDLLVIDEMHYGSDTDKAQTTVESLNIDKTLFVSGTPLDALVSGRFDDQNTYTWSYSDEQKKRKAEKDSGWETEVYRWLPPMSIHSFEVSDEAKKNIACYSEEEQFTMTKMFASDDGETFNDEPSVKLWLDQVFGFGVHKTNSPIRTFAPDHSLWVLPRDVKSVTALSNYLEKYPPTQGYEIINVAGNNISSLLKVKRLIAKNDKTITITCGRFNTGTTVPEWDAVFMLNDGKSPETYFQTIFRVQSPDKGRRKEECHVFDFNPERLLELVYSYAELTAKKTQTTNSGVREFLDFCPILDHTENKVRTIDAEEVVSFISEAGSYIDKFTSGYLFNSSEATNHIQLLDIVGSVNNVKKGKVVTANDTEKGKNYESLAAQKKSIKAQKDLHRQLIEKAKVITKKIPAYVLWVDPIGNTEQLLKTNSADFEEHFEVKLQFFSEMITSGFVNSDRLDRYIGAIEQE